MASKIVLVLRIFEGTQLKTFGARSFKQQPCSHLSVQNKVFLLFPISEVTATRWPLQLNFSFSRELMPQLWGLMKIEPSFYQSKKAVW